MLIAKTSKSTIPPRVLARPENPTSVIALLKKSILIEKLSENLILLKPQNKIP